MDDDISANEEFFLAEQRLRHMSFDSTSDVLSLGEDFPFLDASLLHPGTHIVKIGATTGITSGLLVGVRSVTYEEKGTRYLVDSAVVVQWEPGQRFAAGGDSGSVYYAKLGSFTYPIAIHRAQAIIETPNYLKAGGDKLCQIVSIGTPLRNVVLEFKRIYDVSAVSWFKTKEA
jgi:hypothetical protein